MPYGWGRVPYGYADRLPWMNLPFPVEEYHERLRRLALLMARDGIECLVVFGNRADGTNIRYLTNFEDFYGGGRRLGVAQHGPAAGLLREMRAIKTPGEVEVMRHACRLADEAARAAMDAVGSGVTEFDLAAEANYAMFKAGAEHPAFAIAVCAGARAGFKHMAPTGYRVREGDMVYIDVGGRYMGYHSDISRQRVCGTPTVEQLRFMETQIAIVEEVMAAARPGAVIGDLAEVALARARQGG